MSVLDRTGRTDEADGAAVDVLRRRVEAHEYWYHTIDVAPGVATPGQFDLRHALDLMPWPDVRGKRCLDVGTFDGFFAFEMERRGAAEVVAIDIEDHELWDWPLEVRAGKSAFVPELVFRGPPKGAGFRILAEAFESQVQWRALSIYDLDPAVVGEFDVVVCGSLLLHLRDPIRALEALRSVCRGAFMSSEQIEIALSLVTRRIPLFRLDGRAETCQWWLANSAGHERLLSVVGFEVEERSPFFQLRLNPQPPEPRTLRWRARQMAVRYLTGDPSVGVLHRAVTARPRW